eukprot:1946400-Ditylum_brightwellii.AAC.1
MGSWQRLGMFVESQKSKPPGLNPRWGRLKVKPGTMRSVTGACGGWRSWMVMALCKRGASQCYGIPCQTWLIVGYKNVSGGHTKC